jgi:mannan endo-1,4-beta-mannosidase
MYEVYQSLSPIQAYMQAFQTLGLPLVVGEFGPINNGQFVDSESVIAQAAQRNLGYIGWSWSGNGGGGTGLDMTVNFDPAQLTTWGNRIVNGTNGIRATSVLASVFGTSQGPNLVVSPTSLSFASAASSSAVSVTANLSWTVTDNQGWISVSPTSGSNNGSFTVSVTANTGTAARTGTVTATGGGITRTIAVTQAAPAANNLTVSPTSLSLASAASSGNATVTANVSWTVSDNQTWISTSATGGSGNGSFTVSASANTGSAARTGTVTVSGGGITRTIAVSQAGQSSGGSVTATGTVTSSSGWFSEEQVRVNNTANITALTVTITVQRTSGVNASGQYNTVGGQITQSSSCTSTVCTYVYTLNSGQTLTPGTGRTFAAQMSGNGTVHPTSGDTFTVTGTSGGAAFSLQGAFQP